MMIVCNKKQKQKEPNKGTLEKSNKNSSDATNESEENYSNDDSALSALATVNLPLAWLPG